MKYRFLPLCLAAVSMTVAAEAGAVASAELLQDQAFTYGRFEARVRFAAGDGVISSFFLWKPGSEMAGVFWNELDFEKLGADCGLQTNPLYGLPVVDHHVFAMLDADLCSDYHTYAFEWTPTYIAYLVDGVEIRRDGEETAAAFAENAPSGMQIHFNVWPGDASFGGNFDAAILPVRQYLSWVQYSSFADGAFTFQWREEFDGPALPSGWTVGTWASPKNLSTHQPANVVLSGGVAVLSLTADGEAAFTGSPPPDPGMGSVSGPDPSAGAGGAPGTSGDGGQPPGGGAYGGADGGAGRGGATNGGVSSGANAGTANGGAATSPTGMSAAGSGGTPSSAPPRESSDGGCSHVASSRARPEGAAWLALGAVALVACRRRPRWLQRGRPSSRR